MAMARPRVLITGFGPFPGAPENPSAWLAKALVEWAPPECDAELNARVLPTEWRAVTFMPKFYASLQPTLMIHFGIHQQAKALRLERSAHNRTNSRADASGALPPSARVHFGGPDRLDTALPVPELAARLRGCGVPAASSRSAGSYLCNFLYYHSLAWAKTSDSVVLFVHIPPVDAEGVSEATLLRGAQAILRFGLDLAPVRARRTARADSASDLTQTVIGAKEA
jgi:pyroglutamyl-peptidase